MHASATVVIYARIYNTTTTKSARERKRVEKREIQTVTKTKSDLR